MESSRSRELVDSLRSLGLDRHIELPQIVAMGDTSSGKSSLLSALSGITFPSDKELTTRCPTQLILTDSPTFSGTVCLQRYDNPTEGNPPEVLGKMEDITLAIERITRQLVDEGQSISDDAIVINVKGPNLPNLTLTDLPGIVRSVKDGENPAMIGKVRALINRYMIQERTVILAVHPANVDIHNSEILNNASEADPDGSRTICVITKPDLVDTGSEQAIIDLLNNNVKFLKLG
jgi:interferon-induced GTP-binding protein Mx1